MRKAWRFLGVSIGLAGILYPGFQSGNSAEKERLETLLRKAGEYCARLDLVTLHFVCVEDVTEKIYEPYRTGHVNDRFRTEKNNYVYDFQMIRKGAIEERRTLLKENGKALNVENAALKTQRFQYTNLVFGPIGLFSSAEQAHYNYSIEGEKKLWGHPVVVVRAVPSTAEASQYVWGTAWIDAADGSVLKIEWAEESLDNFAGIRAFAARLNAKPNLKFSSEFQFEKNGIRFPSRFTMNEDYREAYVGRGTTNYYKSEINVSFRDYKFFTVEVEAKIIREEKYNKFY
jgi:hypothetical protein